MGEEGASSNSSSSSNSSVENNTMHHGSQMQKVQRENLSNNGDLKSTPSQTMLNSNLLNQLPHYIFQSDHASLKSVKNFLNEVKMQNNPDAALNNSNYELSDYPIEYIENQLHAIERHMSIR
jgi:hypothetical protein